MSLSAALLAGGESRRMGRDKATLEWRGRPLWQWQMEKLRALSPDNIFLSARTDVSWRPGDAELIVDLAPSRGPLSGLAAALEAMETNHLLALAIDMPFVTTEHLQHLRDLAVNGKGVVPIIEGKAEPLCAVYPKEARPVFLEALHGTDFSLQPIVRQLIGLDLLRELPVSGDEQKFYQNINQPRDLDLTPAPSSAN
jgi:molybdopterin-guanine dinucleotide biosynthesis protein A